MNKIKKSLLLVLSLAMSTTILTSCSDNFDLSFLQGIPFLEGLLSSEVESSDIESSDEGSSDEGSSDVGSSDGGSSESTGPVHEHSFTELNKDAAGHWYECECGEAQAATAHSGGSATCEEKAECEVCGEAYGNLAAHEYTELKFDETNHWYECECGEKQGDLCAVFNNWGERLLGDEA